MDKVSLDYVSELVNFSKECQEMHRLFMATPKEEIEASLNARVKTMKKLARKIPHKHRGAFAFLIMIIMVRLETWRVEKPTSPFLILLESGVIDPNGGDGVVLLINLSQQSSSSSQSCNTNQVILGRQLLKFGANPNKARENRDTALTSACYCFQPTNLEFIELLLEHGADRNHHCIGGTGEIMLCFSQSL